MEYRNLGKSGLQVSVLSFGTMTFGGQGEFKHMGDASVKEASKLIDICLNAGINLFDTADMYSTGRSEEILGAALGKKRSQALIATKAFYTMGPGKHQVGASRLHLIEACEASLKRLGTDYIDLYQMHNFDSLTPLEETLSALDLLVRQGKVRYIGCSNYSAWHLMKALSISERKGYERFISQQVYYSLLARELENELVPLAVDQNVGCIIWSPLCFGLLTGKYRRGQPQPKDSRLAHMDAPGTIDWEKLYRIVDLLEDIGKSHNKTIPQVALNWLLRRPAISSLIFGARNEQQLQENLGAVGWSLPESDVRRLEDASESLESYPYWHQNNWGANRNSRVSRVYVS